MELRSRSGSWQFSVFGLQFAAALLLFAALILFFSFDVHDDVHGGRDGGHVSEFARWRMASRRAVWVMALTTARGLPRRLHQRLRRGMQSDSHRERIGGCGYARRLRGGMELEPPRSPGTEAFVRLVTSRRQRGRFDIGCACGDLPGGC